MEQIKLDSDKFKEFIKNISILKEICNDTDIREGFIRQRINTFSCIFEIDLTPLIGHINLPIVSIKQKLDVLKMFNGRDVEVSVDESTFSFSDGISIVRFNIPLSNYMDNQFMSGEDLNKLFILEEEDLILEYNLDKTITERIKIIKQGFDADILKMVFGNNVAKIESSSQDKNQMAELIQNISTNKNVDGSIINIDIIPFMINYDENAMFKLYSLEGDESCIGVFKGKISNMDIRIFTKSPIIESEE